VMATPDHIHTQPPAPGLPHPQDAMFASCYHCGVHWRAAGTIGLRTALRQQRAFVKEHAACPRPQPTCPHGHAGCCGHHDLVDQPIHQC
jgi:hypothetical protein